MLGFLVAGGNEGSGGGWHVDSWLTQYKAMVYLSDVNITNGPFEYVLGSNRLQVRIWLLWRKSFSKSTRFQDSEVEEVIRRFKFCRKVTFTGGKGTVVLFDPCGLHRGAPIQSGSRLAMTNYYMPHFMKNSSIKELSKNV
jgi:ectoine hydroxylase-related dioxygenase (phytanoyl-CoA dioxygenase family)